jgi:hypothetical protein
VGPQNVSPSFSTAFDGAAAVATPKNMPFGGGDCILHAGKKARLRRTAFDFSVFQQQHEEGAWILSTLSCDNADATRAAIPQGTAGGHHMAKEVAVTTTSLTIYPDDLPISVWVPKKQRKTHQDHETSPVRPFLCAARPRLVVGRGQFGGQVGLLGTLQPPELIKYLTVSEF